jgi:acyl-CoA thioester hydrolase
MSKNLQPSDLAGLPLTYEGVIPESYLDEMGHVNVMWYTHFFSCGTGGMFELYGLTREFFEANQAGGFALEAHVRYLSELRVGKRISVRSRAIARSAKRFQHIHFVVNEDDGVIAATGEFVGAYIDMRERRMAVIPEPIAAAYDRLIEEHNRVGWDPPLCGIMKP